MARVAIAYSDEMQPEVPGLTCSFQLRRYLAASIAVTEDITAPSGGGSTCNVSRRNLVNM